MSNYDQSHRRRGIGSVVSAATWCLNSRTWGWVTVSTKILTIVFFLNQVVPMPTNAAKPMIFTDLMAITHDYSEWKWIKSKNISRLFPYLNGLTWEETINPTFSTGRVLANSTRSSSIFLWYLQSTPHNIPKSLGLEFYQSCFLGPYYFSAP